MTEAFIRPILPQDNEGIARVIRHVLVSLGVPKVGTAYADEALNMMYETYQAPRSVYFVVIEKGIIIGGAGIAPLANYKGNVCELQKMYFLEQARGKGIGSAMMKRCMEAAKQLAFDQCYLETMTYMKAAQSLYKRSGFEYLDGPLGNTGHFSCPVQMLKKISL